MITIYDFTFTYADLFSVAFFLSAWSSYAFFADYRKGSSDRMLVKVMYQHRFNWMMEMLKRDNRMVDAKVVSNVMSSVTFFASTSIFILAGLLTLLGNSEQGINLLANLPFSAPNSTAMWELKIVLLMIIFTYSFFKHTWSLRQFNYTSILISGAPVIKDEGDLAHKYATRVTKMISLAAANFNMGLRAYYFGLAALTWFIHPILFMACTTWVVYILFRREIRSRTLRILMEEPFSS